MAKRIIQSESVLQNEVSSLKKEISDGFYFRTLKITGIQMTCSILVTSFSKHLNWNVFLPKLANENIRNPKNFIFLVSLRKWLFGNHVFLTLWEFFLKKFWNWQQLILVRGSTTDYENFLRALRKRNGGWQGYLAEIMDVTQVRPPQTRWWKPNESFHMSHRRMSNVTWPQKSRWMWILSRRFSG